MDRSGNPVRAWQAIETLTDMWNSIIGICHCYAGIFTNSLIDFKTKDRKKNHCSHDRKNDRLANLNSSFECIPIGFLIETIG